MAAARNLLPRPGLLFGDYPERPGRASSFWPTLADVIGAPLTALHRQARRRERSFLRALARARAKRAGSRESIAACAARTRAQLVRQGWRDEPVCRAHALVAEAVHAAHGIWPHAGQHLAARAMLGDAAVEMGTGEGKSIALLMAAATAAMAGVPVHVITANDALARRDSAAAAPILQALGLRVAAVDALLDTPGRRRAYQCDVVFLTPRELGFDYLRDRLAMSGTEAKAAGSGDATGVVLRGLNLALIDEADSVLLDMAATPLILARPDPSAAPSGLVKAVWALSARLAVGVDFTLDVPAGRVELRAPAGRLLANALANESTNALANPPGQPEPAPVDPRVPATLLRQALVVRHILRKDHHYIVQPASADPGRREVALIDLTTGRVSPGTQWSRGLQALVSLKEGCDIPEPTRVCEQITLRSLFGRFWKLGGASGTLREARHELRLLYGLRFEAIAPRHPSQMRDLGLRLVTQAETQRSDVVASLRKFMLDGRPVLLATGSVESSEAWSATLGSEGIAHQVINARHAENESARLAHVGSPGAVTISTAMAGRGVDIVLSPEALAAGGLHVIATDLGASSRIDRQLFGRAARNGQPGSYERALCTSAGVFGRSSALWFRCAVSILPCRGRFGPFGSRLLVDFLQRKMALLDFCRRWQLAEQERHARRLLTYAGSADRPDAMSGERS